MTRMRWEIGDRLSPLHASRCWAAGLVGIDGVLATAMTGPLTEMTQRLAADDVDLGIFWRCLVAEAAASQVGGSREDQEFCRQALTVAGAGEWTLDSTASAVASRLAEIRMTFSERFPKLAQQLSLRGRPLREQWEAVGPGLLRLIGKQTHEAFLPKGVTAVLLLPYLGGGGDCDPRSGTLWIEAVLTNPVPEVPEVLRLAWLVGRIGLHRGLHPEARTPEAVLPMAGGDRSTDLLSLASIPIVLQAAAELELVPTPDTAPDRIGIAATQWCGQLPPGTIDVLTDWWKQSRELKPAFPISIKALDRMLPSDPNRGPETLA